MTDPIKLQLPPPSHSIREFEGLRGLLAVWVLLGHWGTTISQSLKPLPQNLLSPEAVNVFIILSGFVVSAMLYKNRAGEYRHYIIRRGFRIWPSFAVIVFISLLFLPFTQQALMQSPPSLGKETRIIIAQDARDHLTMHFGLHMALLHGLVPMAWDRFASYTLVGQGWSISLEWQFYLLAPYLFLLIIKKGFHYKIVLLAIIILLVAGGKYFDQAFLGNKIGYFAIGWLSWNFWSWYVKNNLRYPLKSYRFILAMLFIIALALWHYIGVGIAVWIALFGATLLSRDSRSAFEKIAVRPLLNQGVQFLGTISYTLYLVHFQVMIIALSLLERLSLSSLLHSIALLMVTLSSSIAAAILMTRLIEQPGIRLGKKLALRLN